MSLREQIRSAKNPESFILAAKQATRKGEDPNLIIPKQFGEMAARLLAEKIDTSSGTSFCTFREVAHHATQGGKLLEPFYAAANNGFSDMEIGTRWNKYNWPEFFQVVAQPLRTDNRLRVIVAKQVVNGFLPRLVWLEKETPATLDMATGIICALDTVPDLLASLEPQIVRHLVARHIARENGHVNAAVKLTEMRASNAFTQAIAGHENAQGKHVYYYEVSIKRERGDYGAESVSLALEFDRVADTVTAYELTAQRDQTDWQIKHTSVRVMDAEGVCDNYQAQIADALATHSGANLPQQDWVKPIAERMALELMA